MSKKIDNYSKSERLIYFVMFLWVVFGILGIKYNSNLTQIAGYYASLTLFIGTYLWGEYKRTSSSTTVFSKGKSSSREIVIYVTVLLWTILGIFGIIKNMNINNLTVYFSSLSPFVTSYIIYKTTKGNDLPIFNNDTQNLIDKSKEGADKTSTNIIKPINNQTPTNKTDVVKKIENTPVNTPKPQIDKENEIIIPKSNIEIKDEPVD
mgnify:CR=1 FL=1